MATICNDHCATLERRKWLWDNGFAECEYDVPSVYSAWVTIKGSLSVVENTERDEMEEIERCYRYGNGSNRPTDA